MAHPTRRSSRSSRSKHFGSVQTVGHLATKVRLLLKQALKKKNAFMSTDVEERQFEWGRIDAYSDVLELLGVKVDRNSQ